MGYLCHSITSISLIICLIMTSPSKSRLIATAYDITGSKAIVGSGMSGLWLARLITDAGTFEATFLYHLFSSKSIDFIANLSWSSSFILFRYVLYRYFKS